MNNFFANQNTATPHTTTITIAEDQYISRVEEYCEIVSVSYFEKM